jgi:alkylhydroperoxidase family enzyme
MTDVNRDVTGLDAEPRVPRLAPDDVEGPTRAIFDAFVQQRGNVPNLFRVAAHRPPIVQTLHAHMQAVMGPGEVSVLLKELLSVRVSLINDCEY